MRRLYRLFSLLLLAVWLPATLHCNLEAAGLVNRQCTDGCPAEAGQARDGCGVVETGLYKADSDFVKAPAPDLRANDLSLCAQLIQSLAFPEPTIRPAGPAFVRPPGWVTMWNFVRRAAPPSRAPSALGA